MSNSTNLGVMAQMQLEDPIFSEILWKMTPTSLAVRLSQGQYKTWNYIQLLSRKLVDVAMGRCPRLIVCLPPRHGKSFLVSQWFPVWYLENFPERKIILASYEADFAARWGGKVRDIIIQNQEMLNVRMKVKNPAQHYFETSEDGSMACAGVGGPLTGKGANLLIIDDYVKNSEEANSLTMREKTWDWWTSTARTRIEPFMDSKTHQKVQPAVIVMATRWNADDLIGRLINPQFSNDSGEREQWEVFVFPALAEAEAEQHYRQFDVTVNDLRMGSLSGAAHTAHAKSMREQFSEAENPEWRDILGRKRG
ncbi:MAG: terminase family protein, partial [Candidatus Sulfotelmatobacter sp.]